MEAIMCDGALRIYIPDESSMRCTVCGWIGWPQQDVEPGTGRILKVYPHVRQNLDPFIGAVADLLSHLEPD